MKEPLNQITQRINNLQITKPQLTNQLKLINKNIHKQNNSQTPQNSIFKQLISISSLQLNYGQCIPTTIHEETLTLQLTQNLPQPITFTMQIICQDKQIKQLPEYVFAIKKGKECEFTDCFKFKLYKKGKYDFTIAVKSPHLDNYNYKVQALLRIFWEFTDLSIEKITDCYQVSLKQILRMPNIESPKQLEFQNVIQNIRVLKFVQSKTKPRKQVKIPFKLDQNIKLSLVCELLGGYDNDFQKGLIQIKSSLVHLTGKGHFFVNLKLNFPEYLAEYLQNLQKKKQKQSINISYTLRRVLVLRINQTSFYYHFPIEIAFILGNKKSQQ